MATKSASNVAERTPVSTAASANVKGTHGAAIGYHLLTFLEEKAKAVSKVNVSLKEKLQEFYDFTKEDFAAYFATTRKWREDVKAEAAKLKITVTQYRASAEGMDYVYVTVSEFDRLARAVETGWRPEVDRLTWAAIKQEATDRLESEGKRVKRESVKAELDKIMADPTVDPVVKQANKVILEAKLTELAKTSEPKKAGAPAASSTKTNFQIACEMLEKFPLQDMELVYAWLGKRIKDKSAGTPSVKTATTGTDPVQRPPEVKAPAPVKAKVQAKKPESEKATAKGNKRSRK